MDVHHLNCGTMCPMGARFMNDAGKMSCHCLLIESSDGLILVDTGFGTRDLADPAKRFGALNGIGFGVRQDESETAIRQIQRLGLKSEDVRHIVLTHLDFDHAGGLSDFPAAQVHVLAIEHAAAMRPTSFKDKLRYKPVEFSHGVKWKTHSISGGEKWFGFENVRPLPGVGPEVLLIPLFGHSEGHCGVAVNTPLGWILHAGDAVIHHDELDPVFPAPPLMVRMFERFISKDFDAFKTNRMVLRDFAQGHKAEVKVINSHDPYFFNLAAPPAPKPAAPGSSGNPYAAS